MICITEIAAGMIMAPVGPAPGTFANSNILLSNNTLKNKLKDDIDNPSINKTAENNSFDSRMKDITVRNMLTNKPTKTPNVFKL